jgi:5'-3' exonuclease
VPGEGEHKIMQYIRELRDESNYDPNTSHCMYGQDADLIMLGLVSHEPHFTLLREVIDFSQNRNRGIRPGKPLNVTKTVVKRTNTADFQLLHISVLREYLQIELCQDFYKARMAVNLERVIDDFVFMTFLVGNDFLPHLPSLDISEGAFDRLFQIYKSQFFHIHKSQGRPITEAYLTLNGRVPNLERLEAFFQVCKGGSRKFFFR